jgi:hypothetical protein
VKAATNDVVYIMIRNMDRSTVSLEELTVQRKTIGIIVGEYSEWKVNIQEILSDVVKDVKEHGDERTVNILEETVNKAMDKMERAFTGIYDETAKLKIDFFCEGEDGNKVIRDLIIDKAVKGFFGICTEVSAEIDEPINPLPHYSNSHDELVSMIQKLDDVGKYDHNTAVFNHQEQEKN